MKSESTTNSCISKYNLTMKINTFIRIFIGTLCIYKYYQVNRIKVQQLQLTHYFYYEGYKTPSVDNRS